MAMNEWWWEVSFQRFDGLQHAKQFAVRMGRTAAVAFGSSSRDQCAKARPVERRIACHKLIECIGVCEQALAPLFQRMLARRVFVMTVRPRVEPAANGFRIDVTHETADVLKLAFPATPRRDGSR